MSEEDQKKGSKKQQIWKSKKLKQKSDLESLNRLWHKIFTYREKIFYQQPIRFDQ